MGYTLHHAIIVTGIGDDPLLAEAHALATALFGQWAPAPLPAPVRRTAATTACAVGAFLD